MDIGKTIKELRQKNDMTQEGLATILSLSPQAVSRWDTALSFLPLVDGVVFSYQELVVKPDREIFDILCKRYDINPSEAVFLDDNKPNVIAAREYGMHAIHFTSYEEGRAELEEILANK